MIYPMHIDLFQFSWSLLIPALSNEALPLQSFLWKQFGVVRVMKEPLKCFLHKSKLSSAYCNIHARFDSTQMVPTLTLDEQELPLLTWTARKKTNEWTSN